MKFKYYDHTADVMFEAYGKTLEEAFSNAALAMFNILTDVSKVKSLKKFSIKISAKRKESLLFDFLDELLFYLDTQHIIVSKVKNLTIEKKKNYTLLCDIFGDLASNYETHGDVKAPTYNEMEIKETKNSVVLKVVVDI